MISKEMTLSLSPNGSLSGKRGAKEGWGGGIREEVLRVKRSWQVGGTKEDPWGSKDRREKLPSKVCQQIQDGKARGLSQ